MTNLTPLPASHTKHLPLLVHPFPRSTTSVQLIQLSSTTSTSTSTQNGQTTGTGTTGTTLWMGAQVMSCYLSEILGSTPREHGGNRPKKILELGGGVGYLALFLASIGHQVITTDIQPSLSSVLEPNISYNTFSHAWRGSVSACHLDWNSFLPIPSTTTTTTTTTTTNDKEEEEEQRIAFGVQVAKKWLDGISIDIQSFDMIISTDTIYHPSLLIPFLITLLSFSLISSTHSSNTPPPPPPSSSTTTPPPIYIALENRDPYLITRSLSKARLIGFEMKKIGKGRIERCLGKSGWIDWLREGKDEIFGDVDGSDQDEDDGGEDDVDEKKDGGDDGILIPSRQDWKGVEIWKWRYIGTKGKGKI